MQRGVGEGYSGTPPMMLHDCWSAGTVGGCGGGGGLGGTMQAPDTSEKPALQAHGQLVDVVVKADVYAAFAGRLVHAAVAHEFAVV